MYKDQFDKTIVEMKKYAEDYHVPIMEDEGIHHLTSLLKEQKPKNVLEIGAAIGFSALKIAEALPDAIIDTIERDEDRYSKAVDFINKSGFKQQIRIFKADALDLDIKVLQTSYDAIFIDAAKGQYERFFEKYEVLLNSNGVIYCDNMHMHGLSAIPLSKVPRKKRTMIRNLNSFKDSMVVNAQYETTLLDSGDGIMICKKR